MKGAAVGHNEPLRTALRHEGDGQLRVDSESSTLGVPDIGARIGGATYGLPRWMASDPSTPVIDAVALSRERTGAWCQAL